MAPKTYQQRQQAASNRAANAGSHASNHTNNSANRPKNDTKSNKPKKPAAADPAAPDPNAPDAGYYDSGNLPGYTGDPFDPNNRYGRATPNPDVPDFKTWLANQGINAHHLNDKRRQRLQEQHDQLAGPPTSADNPQGEFYGTDEGRAYASDHPDDYNNWLMGKAGALSGTNPLYGGPTQFGQWLANDYQDILASGYQAARDESGQQLGYEDYMKTMGWTPGGSGNFNTASTSLPQLNTPAPHDTGNPFTSTSLPVTGGPGGGAGSPGQASIASPTPQNAVNAFSGQSGSLSGSGGHGGPGHGIGGSTPTLPHFGTPASTNPGGVEDARMRYASLTPQQRGINAATVFKPARWSVF